MKLIVTAISHSEIEIDAWKKVIFIQVEIKDFWEKGVLSATANKDRFSPLSAILKTFEYHDNLINEQIDKSNESCKLILHHFKDKNLILVPSNKPSDQVECHTEKYTFELIRILNQNKFKYLHFTHFGFMNELYFKNTINKILYIFLNPKIHKDVDYIFFDVDVRHLDKFVENYMDIARNKLFISTDLPQILYSKKYQYNLSGDTPFTFID
jgi:hypothetical protein